MVADRGRKAGLAQDAARGDALHSRVQRGQQHERPRIAPWASAVSTAMRAASPRARGKRDHRVSCPREIPVPPPWGQEIQRRAHRGHPAVVTGDMDHRCRHSSTTTMVMASARRAEDQPFGMYTIGRQVKRGQRRQARPAPHPRHSSISERMHQHPDRAVKRRQPHRQHRDQRDQNPGGGASSARPRPRLDWIGAPVWARCSTSTAAPAGFPAPSPARSALQWC